MPKPANEARAPVSSRAAAVVFALLVLATVAAFAYSQRVKRDPLVLDRVSFLGAPRQKGEPVVHAFTPNSDCRLDLMRIRFRTTISGTGTVQVVKPGGRVVYSLARDAFLKRYTFHTYYWDGRSRNDGTAPPGRYKLRVRFAGRTLVAPGVIRLHPAPKGADRGKGGRRNRALVFCLHATRPAGVAGPGRSGPATGPGRESEGGSRR